MCCTGADVAMGDSTAFRSGGGPLEALADLYGDIDRCAFSSASDISKRKCYLTHYDIPVAFCRSDTEQLGGIASR